MTDLFTYPASPGYKDQDTSKDAAESMAGRAPTLRQKCFAELLQGQGTADEVADALGVSILAVRPRFTELLALGKIADTGRRRTNKSGRMAKVWYAVNTQPLD